MQLYNILRIWSAIIQRIPWLKIHQTMRTTELKITLALCHLDEAIEVWVTASEEWWCGMALLWILKTGCSQLILPIVLCYCWCKKSAEDTEDWVSHFSQFVCHSILSVATEVYIPLLKCLKSIQKLFSPKAVVQSAGGFTRTRQSPSMSSLEMFSILLMEMPFEKRLKLCCQRVGNCNSRGISCCHFALVIPNDATYTWS